MELINFGQEGNENGARITESGDFLMHTFQDFNGLVEARPKQTGEFEILVQIGETEQLFQLGNVDRITAQLAQEAIVKFLEENKVAIESRSKSIMPLVEARINKVISSKTN